MQDRGNPKQGYLFEYEWVLNLKGIKNAIPGKRTFSFKRNIAANAVKINTYKVFETLQDRGNPKQGYLFEYKWVLNLRGIKNAIPGKRTFSFKRNIAANAVKINNYKVLKTLQDGGNSKQGYLFEYKWVLNLRGIKNAIPGKRTFSFKRNIAANAVKINTYKVLKTLQDRGNPKQGYLFEYKWVLNLRGIKNAIPGKRTFSFKRNTAALGIEAFVEALAPSDVPFGNITSPKKGEGVENCCGVFGGKRLPKARPYPPEAEKGTPKTLLKTY